MLLFIAGPLYNYDNAVDQENYCPMIMVSVLIYVMAVKFIMFLFLGHLPRRGEQ